MLASGVTASTQALIDKVFELADANGLPSNGYKSDLSGFSADKLRMHLNKVCYLMLLIFWIFIEDHMILHMWGNLHM